MASAKCEADSLLLQSAFSAHKKGIYPQALFSAFLMALFKIYRLFIITKALLGAIKSASHISKLTAKNACQNVYSQEEGKLSD